MGSIFGSSKPAPAPTPPPPPPQPVAEIKTAKLETGKSANLSADKTNLKDRLKIKRVPNTNTLSNEIGLGKIN